MRKKLKISSILVILLMNILVVYSVYTESYEGNGNLSIAKPKIVLYSEEEQILLDKKETYSNTFEVRNYDEYSKITELQLSYKLKIKVNYENSPLCFELYKIENNGNERKILLNDDWCTEEEFQLSANVIEKQLFRLDVFDDESGNILNDNTKVEIELNAVN